MRIGQVVCAAMMISAAGASATTRIDFRVASGSSTIASFRTQGSDLFVTGPGIVHIWDTPSAFGPATIEIGFGADDHVTITQAGQSSLLRFDAAFAHDWFVSGAPMPLSGGDSAFDAAEISTRPAPTRFEPLGDLVIAIGGRAIRVSGLRAGGTPWTLFNIDVGTDVPVRAAPVAEGIPEPVSWTLMITGFALVGAALRRRTPHAA